LKLEKNGIFRLEPQKIAEDGWSEKCFCAIFLFQWSSETQGKLIISKNLKK
jgi:hypothetical protein